MARNRETSNVSAAATQPEAPQNNVITASNVPPMRSNVIRPIVANNTPSGQARLVPANGSGVGSVMSRVRAEKAARNSKGALIVKNI